MSSQNSQSPAPGLAVFVATIFVLAVATIAALDRVGVPDRLVRSTGPILALFSLAVVGLSARNADLASFVAARRGVPAKYGALALPVVFTGIALCLHSGLASDPSLNAVAAGVALGAIAYAPLIRRFGATSANDVVATRFSGSPLPAASAIVAFITAALTALAGYRIAVAATEAVTGSSSLWAEFIVATALFLSVAPGGLAGVIWCAVASAGELAVIVVFAFAAGWFGPPLADPVVVVAPPSLALTAPQTLVAFAAATLAVAGFFAVQPQAIASRNAASAVRAGLAGSVLCAALVAIAIAPRSLPLGLQSTSDSVAASLIGVVSLVSALTLAGVGLNAASRAFGIPLAEKPRPFSPASVRLARMRGAQLAVVIGCAICDSKGFPDAPTALIVALSLSLALTTPIVILAAIGRVGPLSASFGFLAALAVVAWRVALIAQPPGATDAFEDALMAGAAAFVAGASVCLVLPRRHKAPTPGGFDPYADSSRQP